MKVNDAIHVEPMFDYQNGRRFQILVINKTENELFSTHKDVMGRDYVKLKLSDSDIMQLINQLSKNLKTPTTHLKLIEPKDD